MNVKDDANLSAKKTTISLRNNANRRSSSKRASSKRNKVGDDDEFGNLGLSGAQFEPMFK